MRAVVGQLQLRVGVDDAHERDVVEVKALRNHLRTQQHGGVGSGELLEQALVRAFAAGGVGVHADDGHIRPHALHTVKHHAQLGFHALRSRAELLQVRASALRAHRRRGTGGTRNGGR